MSLKLVNKMADLQCEGENNIELGQAGVCLIIDVHLRQGGVLGPETGTINYCPLILYL